MAEDWTASVHAAMAEDAKDGKGGKGKLRITLLPMIDLDLPPTCASADKNAVILLPRRRAACARHGRRASCLHGRRLKDEVVLDETLKPVMEALAPFLEEPHRGSGSATTSAWTPSLQARLTGELFVLQTSAACG